jgi:hypothetical protein
MLILTPCLVLAKVEARAKAKYPSVPAAPANLTSLLLRYHLNRFSASARTFTTFSNVMSGPVAQQQSSSIAGRTPPAVSTIVALCPPASFDSGTIIVNNDSFPRKQQLFASDNNDLINDASGTFLCNTFSSISGVMENSVTKSSRISHSVGWHRWLKFTSLVGTDPFLRKVPLVWSQWSLAEGSLFNSFPVTCVAGFLCFLVNDKFAPVQPSTAINYLSAVRFNLVVGGVAVDFMDDSLVVQKTRTGFINEYVAQ